MAAEDTGLQTVKIILVGNGSAGKTSVCTRFKQDGFQRVYKQTIGIDFYERKLRMRGKEVVIQLWDIGGQSIGSSMMGQYIWATGVVFLLYDVTDTQSFRDVEDWLALVRRPPPPDATAAAERGGSPPDVYLVGNKIDLVALRKVSQASHDSFVRDKGLQGGFFISARSGDNVLTAFYQAAAARIGVELSKEELAATEKVLGVVAAAGDDGARVAGADAIEAEDAAAERRKGGGCCVLQ